MWDRVVECMLACWLAVSPFVFGHPADATLLWASDFATAATVAILALLSYWRPTRHAHLLILLAAGWLIGFGRFAAVEPAPGLQSDIVVGLLLLMFAIVPNHAERPPEAWFADSAPER